MNFKIKPEICFGSGAVSYLKEIGLGRVMIVSDPFLIDNGMISLITDVLEEIQIEYTIFSDVLPDSPMSKVAEGVKMIREFHPTEMIVVGGGSAIDISKAIKYFASESMEEKSDVRLIVIPTTSGTGSEATKYSIVLNEETNLKHTIVDDNIAPDYAILDMDFIKSVPNSVAIASGLDVLAHGLEAYVATKANDMTDMYAVKAIEDVFEYLPKVIEENDMEAREKMHMASLLAGIAFDNAGLGINHSIAHVLGGEYGIPHGMLNAIILPYVVKYNSENMEENKYLKLADRLNVSGLAKDIKFNNFLIKIRDISSRLGVPNSLSELKEPKVDMSHYQENLSEMARAAYEDGNTQSNPVIPTVEDFEQLLLDIYTGV